MLPRNLPVTRTEQFLENQELIPRHTSAKTTLADGSSSNTSLYYARVCVVPLTFIMKLDGITCEVLFGIDILNKFVISLTPPLNP